MKTYIKSILALATAALLGSSAWAVLNPSTNPISELQIGTPQTITLTNAESTQRTLTFTSSGAQTDEWSNDYISVKLSSSTIAANGQITATITGKKATNNQQSFTIYRSTRTTQLVTINVTKVVEGEKTATSAVFNDQTITFPNGAVTNWVGGELVLKFKTGGTLNIPGNATADILAVGGGGAGVMAKSSTRNKYNGNGGNGGSAATATDRAMPAGSYNITVGAGAPKVTSGSNDFNGGSNGGNSSIAAGTGVTGFSTVTGNGGTAWTSQDDSGSGTKDSSGTQASSGSGANLTSTIAGSSYVYGKPGIPPPSNQVANAFNGTDADEYGEGGQGSANGGTSGAGADGVVIVRIKSMVSPKTEVTRNSTLVLKKTAGATTHQFAEPLDSSFTWGTISANPSGVVTASIEKTGAQPKMTVTPQNVAGSTTLTVTGESDTEICTWTVSVTVNDAMPSVNFKGREIEYQNGTADTTTVPGELIMTFTNTTKAGTLIIPEDAVARVLVVGGGAGGVYGKESYAQSSKYRYYNGSGGNAGEVIEKTLADAYTLSAGSYTITVGAGGIGRSAKTGSDADFGCGKDNTGDSAGTASSLVGGSVELTAAGGASWTTPDKGRSTQDGDVFDEGSKSVTATALKANDGFGAAYYFSGKTLEKDVWRTGVESDISGVSKTYAVGGVGPQSTSTVNGTPGDANTGNGGNGSANSGASGAGGSGFVCVRITYPELPIVETLAATPILDGETLADSTVTFTMTNAAGQSVSGSFAWKNASTKPVASGFFTGTFTPDETASYAIVDVDVFVEVKTPIEDSVHVVASGNLPATATTTTSAELWNYVIVLGAEYIGTPVLKRNAGTGAAELSVPGANIGMAVIDLYMGSETPGEGTFVKRVNVAVLPAPLEGEENISVNEDESDSTVTTSAKSQQWYCEVVVGEGIVSVSVDPTSAVSERTATLTVNGLKAGAAIVDIYSGTSNAGTLVKRAIVTVKAPTEGRANRAVGTGLAITVKTEATIDSVKVNPQSGVVSVTPNGQSTLITGGAQSAVGKTAEVRLYSGTTLVKVVTVLVTGTPTPYTWKGRTVSCLGAEKTDLTGGDLLLTFTSSDGLLELPADVVADILVVGGGGSGASAEANTNYQGDGGGGGQGDYREEIKLAGGVYTLIVGAGGDSQDAPGQSGRALAGNPGEDSSITDGADFTIVAKGGAKGADGHESSSSAGTGGFATELEITDAKVTYGANGAAGSTATKGTKPADATGYGQGGTGGNASASAAGGKGVIIVRLHGFVETPVVKTAVTGTVAYGQTIDKTVFAGAFTNSAGEAVTGTYAWKNAAEITSLTVADSGKAYDVVFTPENTTYYPVTTVSGTLIVTPMAVTVYPIATNKVYGAEDPIIDFTTVPDVKGELTGALSRTPGENAGKKHVVIGTLTNENYVLTVSNDGYQMFTINKKPITVTPVDGQEKTIGDETFAIAFTTNVAMIGTDHFTGALAAKDELGEQEITIGTLAIDDGNDGDNYDLTFITGVTIKIVPAAITITVEAGVGVSDVTTNGVSVIGDLTLPADTTEVTLTLTATNSTGAEMTIPVFKVTTNGFTTVTSKTATYAIADGATLLFTAEEAKADDPTVTPEQTKQAIVDAVDPGEHHDAAVAKIDAIVGADEGQVPAKQTAAWITDKSISSAQIADGEFVAASVLLNADTVLTEADEVTVNSASGNVENASMTVSVMVGENDVTEKLPDNVKVVVHGSNDVEQVEMEIVKNGKMVAVQPKDDGVTAYIATINIVSDDGTKTLSSQKVGYLKRSPTGSESKTVRRLVSIPWNSLKKTSKVSVDDFLATDNLSEGTKIYSYNGAGYDSWELDADKKWQKVTTVNAEKAQLSEPPESDEPTFEGGKGIWVECKDTDALVSVGQADDDEAKIAEVTEKDNLVSLPGITAFEFKPEQFTTEPAEGDQITVPTEGEPIVFEYKGGGQWSYWFQKTETIFNQPSTKVYTGIVGDGKAGGLDKIERGRGFWYWCKPKAAE